MSSPKERNPSCELIKQKFKSIWQNRCNYFIKFSTFIVWNSVWVCSRFWTASFQFLNFAIFPIKNFLIKTFSCFFILFTSANDKQFLIFHACQLSTILNYELSLLRHLYLLSFTVHSFVIGFVGVIQSWNNVSTNFLVDRIQNRTFGNLYENCKFEFLFFRGKRVNETEDKITRIQNNESF